MKKACYFYYDRYLEYLDFINICKEKKYDEEIIHKHHIIPSHIDKEISNENNIVYLSVDDHAEAHLLFSRIWPKNTYEYVANIWSVQILKREYDYNLLHEIKETRKGELNGFYGRNHSAESREKMSEGLYLYWSSRKDLKYENLYAGKRSLLEKKKRSNGVKKSWDNLSKKEREDRSKKVAKSLIENGKVRRGLNPAAKKCKYNEIIYNCITDAVEKTELSLFKLKKSKNFKIIK